MPLARPITRFITRLAHDTAGNALMIIAASLLPLLAMVGGGLDIGRGYLVQARLQQACDAGVLAARKRLGTEATVDGDIPTRTAEIGNRFFNTNFAKELYGTKTRKFDMTLEQDYAITGYAEARMPTSLMAVFGQEFIDVSADCSAQLSMSNTDIMMVVDVTGSMSLTNPGDSEARIEVLKDTVSSFYDQLAAAAAATTRLRFGFLPYSTNVNVGGILKDEWVVGSWDYQSREAITVGNQVSTKTYYRNWSHVSGTQSENTVESTYPATWNPGSGVSVVLDENENPVTVGSEGYYSCNTPAPSSTYSNNDVLLSSEENPFAGPPAGTQTVEYRQKTENGKRYWISRDGETCRVISRTYTEKVTTYEKVTEPEEKTIKKWRYKRLNFDVSDWRSASNGCIEERDTYEILDYGNVDLTRARDLDIDTVPFDDGSRWRPMYPHLLYARALKYNGTGSFRKQQAVTEDEYMNPAAVGSAACPPPARKLGVMTKSEMENYLSTLNPAGATYHDIGMIWGGRMLSPNGIFAAENVNVSPAQPTQRHMIFLTDGETETLDISYSSYGLEPLDERRWTETSSLTLTETVEKRFGVACDEVKKRGITVWVIGFGTTLNQIMKDCAGDDHYFEAADSAELNVTFAAIAKSLAELRIVH